MNMGLSATDSRKSREMHSTCCLLFFFLRYNVTGGKNYGVDNCKRTIYSNFVF